MTRGAEVNRSGNVTLPAAGRRLPGYLTVPQDARGVVLFVHGSGSSRLSPRNQFVAEWLNRAQIGTLLFDLLTDAEAASRANVFNVPLLADRVLDAVEWIRSHPGTSRLRIGLFGASTGGGAALVAAARRPEAIGAVVSRGGRPDLAGAWLAHVQAATLLLVGGDDQVVLGLNQQALERLPARCVKRLVVVPGAGHLFEEPGTLARVASGAAAWFREHLGAEAIAFNPPGDPGVGS